MPNSNKNPISDLKVQSCHVHVHLIHVYKYQWFLLNFLLELPVNIEAHLVQQTLFWLREYVLTFGMLLLQQCIDLGTLYSRVEIIQVKQTYMSHEIQNSRKLCLLLEAKS